MENYLVALIGVLGVVVGALISGFFQAIMTKKTIASTEQQFEKQLQQNQIEFYAKIEQLREENKQVSISNANQFFNAENDRFYRNWIDEIAFFDYLSNELSYLRNLTSPKNKDMRIRTHSYPHIHLAIAERISALEFPNTYASLIGALRSMIDYYNAALSNDTDVNGLEELMDKIYAIIGPINDEQFTLYCAAQSGLKKMEMRRGEQELKSI